MKKFFIPLIALSISYFAFAETKQFSDIDTEIYKDSINYLANENIINGYSDGTYKPNQIINRAELTKIIAEGAKRFFNWPADVFDSYNDQTCFPDVAPQQWFTKYICYGKNKGWIKGYDNGTFKPSQNISFAEALKITYQGFNLGYTETQKPWYKDVTEKASTKNYIPQTIINYENLLNRGEMAELISRIIKEKRNFHYQLQDAKYDNLLNLNSPFLVVDIDDANLTKEQLANLEKKNKKVLSYLSIGEAENYRDYWQDNWEVGSPEFLDEENPDWEGNYKVKYWDPDWQKIILTRAKEIAAQGYSGVYLDIIDAYSYYEENGVDDAAEKMIDFVKAIRQETRKINPNFLIFPQNSPELYEFEEYRDAIDGFGKEDTWFNDDDVQTEDEKSMLKFLEDAKKEGKIILSIDYPTAQKNICEFYEKCLSEGFYCVVSNRDLNLDTQIKCQ